MTTKVKKKAHPSKHRTQDEIFGSSHHRSQHVEHIEGDDFVMETGISKDDGHLMIRDVEAAAAKEKLRQKIMRTKDAILSGARTVLLAKLSAHSEQAHDAKEEKIVDSLKEPLKEKLLEFAKGRKGFGNAKIRGNGAAARMIKDKLANESTTLLSKAAGAAAVAGSVKEVFDAVQDAELADFTATTLRGLTKQIQTNVPILFQSYFEIVDHMEAQEAIDAAAQETTEPWVTADQVQAEIEHLFDVSLLEASKERGGVLKGREVFDHVQGMLHPKQEQ